MCLLSDVYRYFYKSGFTLCVHPGFTLGVLWVHSRKSGVNPGFSLGLLFVRLCLIGTVAINYYSVKNESKYISYNNFK